MLNHFIYIYFFSRIIISESAVCENTSCLYCITGLANTVFRAMKTENAIILDPKFVVMYPAAKLISLCILTALVWIVTVLLICCVSIGSHPLFTKKFTQLIQNYTNKDVLFEVR